MYKADTTLHYMYLRVNGKEYRLLASNLPNLIAGNPTSDYFGFFGLGSGEFLTKRVTDMHRKVSYVKLDPEIPVETALLYWKSRPEFIGFVDRCSQGGVEIILDGGDQELFNIPFNWEVYTQLGVQSLAEETLYTLSRAHVAYPTMEEHVQRIKHIINYVRML